MLGVKQPTAPVAAVLLKYGVDAEHFGYARFLKLSRCVLIHACACVFGGVLRCDSSSHRGRVSNFHGGLLAGR